APWNPEKYGSFKEHTTQPEELPPRLEQIDLYGRSGGYIYVPFQSDSPDILTIPLKFHASWYSMEFLNLPSKISRVFSGVGPPTLSTNYGRIVMATESDTPFREVQESDDGWFHTDLEL